MGSSLIKVVLLPGMDGSGDLFEGLVAAMPAPLKTAVVRYPGGIYLSDMGRMALVEAAVQADEPFVLVAESYSTLLAMEYAATKPPNLRGLVLCAGFATSPVTGWRRTVSARLGKRLFWLAHQGLAIRWMLVGLGARRSMVRAVRAAVRDVDARVMASRMDEVLTCDCRRALQRVRVPVLYVRATQDRVVPQRCMEEMVQQRPGMRTVAIEGPHLILQQRPVEAAGVIEAFVARL